MAVYEKELNASFHEVQERVRKQLSGSLRSFKIKEESTYKKENIEILVMSIEPSITVTIAGNKESSWISMIGGETVGKIKIRAGFDLEPDAMQIIKNSIQCYILT